MLGSHPIPPCLGRTVAPLMTRVRKLEVNLPYQCCTLSPSITTSCWVLPSRYGRTLLLFSFAAQCQASSFHAGTSPVPAFKLATLRAVLHDLLVSPAKHPSLTTCLLHRSVSSAIILGVRAVCQEPPGWREHLLFGKASPSYVSDRLSG